MIPGLSQFLVDKVLPVLEKVERYEKSEESQFLIGKVVHDIMEKACVALLFDEVSIPYR